MRTTILASLVALSALAVPAAAQNNFPVVAGVAAGTAVGFGLAEGWFVGTLPSSGSLGITGPGVAGATGAIAGGFVAGIGAMVLLHSITTPCRGFRIGIDNCRDGHLVTSPPPLPPRRRAVRVRG